MADIKLKYASAATLTITLASLGSDSNLLIGRESTVVDNTSNLYVDALIGGKITTGTSPTADRRIRVFAYGTYDGTIYTAGATGSDAGLTLTAKKKLLLALVATIPTANTSNNTYNWGPISLARAFGGILPSKWGIWVVHDTGVNLNSTGSNHEVKFTGVQFQTV